MKNKFKPSFAYTFSEIYPRFIAQPTLIDAIVVDDLTLMLANTNIYAEGLDPWNITFKENLSLVVNVFNRLIEVYGRHYFIITDKELSEESKEDYFAIRRLFRIMDNTFPKYSKLLDLYTAQEQHLLDKLETGESESHSTSQSEQHANIGGEESVMKINDTPQTEDVEASFEDDQYVSELHKSKGSTSDNGNSSITGSGTITKTITSDPTTIMERLNEIKNKYSLVMKNWIKEFDYLFIEEGNI